MNEDYGLYPSQVAQRKLKSLNAKRIATEGEEKAVAYLIQEKNYRIVCRNYRAGRTGEIDIIALEPEGTLVFVEVKSRTKREATQFGIQELGFDAVCRRKQEKILAASRIYLAGLLSTGIRWRYDVIVITSTGESKSEQQLNHVENAFF